MRSDLLQVVYLSHATCEIDTRELGEIQDTATALNGVNGLTGLLLFDGARFLQAIEGREQKVRETMARIVEDRRHTALQIVSDKRVSERQFGDWAMECKRTPPGTCSQAFLRQVKENIDTVADPALKAVFIGFARLAPSG